MRDARSSVVATALLAGLVLMAPVKAKAQALAFTPNVGTIPDGVGLSVSPVVSADRRYVRLSLNANFSTINGFSSFPVAGGVASGGIGGGGLGGLGGGGGNRGAGGGGGGFRNVMGPDDQGIPFRPEYMEASRKATAQAKAANALAKPVKGKKLLADPVMVPMKKGEAKAKANAPAAPRG